MGLLTSKASPGQQHATLIELAGETLRKLRIEIEEDSDGTRPLWTAATNEAAPLEFRHWIGVHIETLAKQARGVPETEFGDPRRIGELAEALRAVRDFLAGLPREVRQRLRGETFARVQALLDQDVARAVTGLTANDGFLMFMSLLGIEPRLEDSIASARTALSWFDDEDTLAAAFALQEHPGEELAEPSLHELRRLVEEGGVALGKVRAITPARWKRRARPSQPSRPEPCRSESKDEHANVVRSGAQSLVLTTGQAWKFQVAKLVGSAGTVVVFLHYPWTWLILVGVVTVALLISIRCPGCGLSLGWHTMRTRPLTRWAADLLSSPACPRCGFSTAESRAPTT